MFRKIHSNRDPQATVFGELKKEFRPFVERIRQYLKRIADGYPRFLFVMMVVNIILSAILVTTVCRRQGDPPKTQKQAALVPVSSGFARIRQAGLALQETIRVKRGIDSLTRLKALSHTDSLALLEDLDSLRHIQLTLNH